MNTTKIFLIMIALISIDQLSKFLVRIFLPLGESIVLTSFFSLTHITNTGIAFGMFQQISFSNTLFMIINILILIFMFIWYIKRRNILKKSIHIVFILIFSGAIGNIIDRILRGEVTDFFDFHIMNYHWPSFNIADTCISIGIILFLIISIRDSKKGRDNISKCSQY